MKTSNLLPLLPLLLPVAYADAQPQDTPAYDATPSLTNVIPPTPLPALQPSGATIDPLLNAQAQFELTPEPSGPIRRKDRRSQGAESLQVRSEGTLGQTPWIGMAIGLTCTALAAVMLG